MEIRERNRREDYAKLCIILPAVNLHCAEIVSCDFDNTADINLHFTSPFKNLRYNKMYCECRINDVFCGSAEKDV